MAYLASFEQESAVGRLLIPARIPVDRLGEEVAVCIGLNLQEGVSGARIVGAEAPRSAAPSRSGLYPRPRAARPTGRPQAPRAKRAISAEGLNAKKNR